MGVMTINEIRRELDLPHLENGDTSFVQVNVQTLKDATTEKPVEPTPVVQPVPEDKPKETEDTDETNDKEENK